MYVADVRSRSPAFPKKIGTRILVTLSMFYVLPGVSWDAAEMSVPIFSKNGERDLAYTYLQPAEVLQRDELVQGRDAPRHR